MVSRTLHAADLGDCLSAAVDVAGIGAALPCAEIRVSSQIVAKRTADNAGDHEFLNSATQARQAFANLATALRNAVADRDRSGRHRAGPVRAVTGRARAL